MTVSLEPCPPRAKRRTRTEPLLQMDAAECGAVALGIVLAHHGRIVPRAELRRACGVSRDGSSAAALIRAARRYGMQADGYRAEPEELVGFQMPCIVFWNLNHFVVLEGLGRDDALLNDPECGHRKVARADFDTSFTGIVLRIAPGADFEPGGRRPSTIDALLRRVSGFGATLGFAVLAGFLLVVPGLALPAFAQVFVDEVVVAQRSHWLRPLIVAMLVAVIAHAGLLWLQLRSLRRLNLALAARLSVQFFEQLMRLPLDFYARRLAGETVTRDRLNDKVARVLSGDLARTAIDVVMMGFYAALMAFYDLRLTAIGLAVALLNLAALRWVGRWRAEANARLLQQEGRVTGTTIDGLQAIETIKASGQESALFGEWAGRFEGACQTRQSLELTHHVLGLLPALLASLATLSVLVLGGLSVLEGRMTIGMLVAFQMLMARFLAPVGNLVQLGETMQELRGDLNRLDDVLTHPTDAHAHDGFRGPAALATESGPLPRPGQLELRNVTFGHDPNGEPLLRNFSLTVRPGQRVALVGASGSGKTTVARLACGLHQPWSGEVRVGGVRRADHLPSGAADGDLLAFVDQDIAWVDGTVRDNLTLWRDGVPDRALITACKDAAIWARIQQLPGGLDAELAEGAANLSGGERQRLEIARALVARPKFLVLDEPTSALDVETEQRVVDRITATGCSCLIVAHRLSTVRGCDEIVVLHDGEIAERGRHQDLFSRNGIYAALVAAGDAPRGGGR
ncbi:MAG: NHLP family bacteriocin export ABC transporter peptidase/permease/ATPase subunit [Planctomycetota bacterium]